MSTSSYVDVFLSCNAFQGKENEERTRNVISSLIELARSSDINLNKFGSLFKNEGAARKKCNAGKALFTRNVCVNVCVCVNICVSIIPNQCCVSHTEWV